MWLSFFNMLLGMLAVVLLAIFYLLGIIAIIEEFYI